MIIAGATPQASACQISPNSDHCYAEWDNLNTANNYGIYGEVNAHCLYVPNSENFATNEIWDASSSSSYREEAGLYSGQGHNISYGDRNWYWADSRPGGDYNEHDSATQANLNASYRVRVEYEGSNTWYIYGNGDYSLFGISVNQSAELTTGEAGTEYTVGSTSGIRDQGEIGNLQRINTSYTFFGWGGNAARGDGGPGNYITSDYDSTNSTVSWSGPC